MKLVEKIEQLYSGAAIATQAEQNEAFRVSITMFLSKKNAAAFCRCNSHTVHILWPCLFFVLEWVILRPDACIPFYNFSNVFGKRLLREF